MTLTLVIPGLLWPRQVMRDALYDAEFPALQTLLGKGRRLATPSTSAEAWWCSYFQIDVEDFAAAPLRLSALGEHPGTNRWLCADPVHLQVTQKGATLTDPTLLNISAVEARQLQAALAPLFASVGELLVTSPSHWHLRLRAHGAEFPAHLNRIIGQPATALLPEGDAGRPWRQMINEAQMTLHAHPLNAERIAQGKIPINSLALWGEGFAPVVRQSADVNLQSNDLIIAGAAQLAGINASALMPSFTPSGIAQVVHWDWLSFPTASRDALAWRERLMQLEQDWMAPALAAMNSGKLKCIALHGFGEDEGASIMLTSFDRYKFWRKPRRLESL